MGVLRRSESAVGKWRPRILGDLHGARGGAACKRRDGASDVGTWGRWQSIDDGILGFGDEWGLGGDTVASSNYTLVLQ